MDVKKINQLKEKYTPPCGMSVGGLALIMAYNDATNKCKSYSESIITLNAKFTEFRIRAVRATHSNNWLKIHGQPTRRKRENRG